MLEAAPLTKIDLLARIKAKQERSLILEECERYEGSLGAFVEGAWSSVDNSTYQPCWAIDAMVDHLEAVTLGHIKRLLINISPRCAKTTVCSILLPVWTWLQKQRSFTSGPQVKFLCASYNHTLALGSANKSRQLITSPWFQKHWAGRIVLRADENAKNLYANTEGGERQSTSVGGSLLGLGGDVLICLPYSERVLTDRGWLPIGDIVCAKMAVNIAGTDNNERIRWQRIESYETNPGGRIVEIEWDTGSLRCTEDHPVYVCGRGYIRADQIKAGETVLAVDDVSTLRKEISEDKGSKNLLLSPVFSPSYEEAFGRASAEATSYCKRAQTLYDLRRLDRVYGCGMEEERCAQTRDRTILRSSLSWAIRKWRQKSSMAWWIGRANLRKVWEAIFGQTGQIAGDALLFYGLSGNPAPIRATAMPRLLRDFSTKPCRQGMLLKTLCRLSALQANGREWQLQLLAWLGVLPLSGWMDKRVQRENSNEGRSSMPSMRPSRQWQTPTSSSPHRLSTVESRSDESDYTVRLVPRKNARQESAPALAAKTVRSIKRCGYEPCTYNLHVGPCHNYFAEGILVHNCDDLNKVAKEKEIGETDAESAAVADFWAEFHSTRLNNPKESAIIVVQQRIKEADVSGLILDSDEDFVHLCIPMRYDEQRHCVTVKLPQYDDDEPWQDPRAVDGDLMWPERFGEAEVRKLEVALGPFMAAGRLQQSPSPKGGGIIKRDWWQPWDQQEAQRYGLEWGAARKEFPTFELVVGSLDTSFGEKQENDYNALTIWGIWLDRNRNRRVMLMFAWAKRLPLHGKVVSALPGEAKVNFRQRQQEAWGLVEWVADTCKRYKVRRLLIEDKTRGRDTAAEINRLYLRENWGVELVNPIGDKVARVHSIVPLFTDGMIWAPDTRWADAVLTQCSAFPKAAHDDYVDSTSMYLNWARENGLILRADEATAALEDEMRHIPSQETVAQHYGV
ncbi:MAG TPA: phage terminase large subunit [Gemmataceae bacterium]|jgi:predicted phage terminase large subunit-like protein